MKLRHSSRNNWIATALGLVLLGGVALPVQANSWASGPDPLFDEEFEDESAGFPDPLEPINRPIRAFNRVVDRFLLNPITQAYGFVVPGPLKKSIRQVFDNAHAAPVIANDIFQGEWKDAGVTSARFLVNSTIGLAGLFDPASHMGLEQHHSDFGQTLALMGVGSGPYLVFPILGPTTLRDGTGVIADSLLSPTLYLLGPTELIFYYYAGSRGLAAREEHMREILALEASAVDYYAVLRNAYFQNRNAEIWSRREHHRDAPEPKDLAGVTPPSR